MSTRKIKRKTAAPKQRTELRHQFQPVDPVTGEAWKLLYPMTDPLVPVTLDRGTFEWLWDFVDRKGRQADASNFHYSDIHRSVYQRAADQFALAAKEAFGDTYRASGQESAEVVAEAPVVPAKRRRRTKPKETTAKSFEASESPVEPLKRKRRRRPRSTTTSAT